MNPQDANPRNFEVQSIVYNDGDFSVAYGRWKDDTMQLAMRWNGDTEEEKGYPKTFGNPMWFIVSSGIKKTILKSLLESKHSKSKDILEILLSEEKN